MCTFVHAHTHFKEGCAGLTVTNGDWCRSKLQEELDRCAKVKQVLSLSELHL